MGRLRDLATGLGWEKIPHKVRAAMLQTEVETNRLNARITELEGALTRQSDNMSFLLDNVDVGGRYGQFKEELAQGRIALKGEGE